ncbi:hypothetical protein TWF696_004049 [Orbilia brochopaga]|uniref:Uncharacterized protein n=1 Tax=Orbilia brochopaga TaxID=3140254 RepID=A0AAV9V7W0_9PEZI
MIRSPSLALKYVNLRGHTLRRVQVRFRRQEDFQAVMTALEQIGCPIQLHNAETVQSIQQSVLNRQFSRPDTASSLITGHEGTAARQTSYSGPGATPLAHMGITAGHAQNQFSLEGQRLNAGNAHIAFKQYISSQPSAYPAHTRSLSYTEPEAQHFRPPMLSRTTSADILAHDSFNSSPPTSQQYIPRHSNTDFTGSQANNQYLSIAHTAEQNLSSHYDPPPAPIKAPSFRNPAVPAHLLRGSSTTSSLLSRPETAASLTNSNPVSRGTHTSVGTLFGNSQKHDSFSREIAHSQQQVAPAPVQAHHSQEYDDPELTDLDDIPPPRRLPDFDKYNKVHGDKPLPSSSAKLTHVFKNTKSGSSPASTSLKRKDRPGEKEGASTANKHLNTNADDSDRENANAKRPKIAAATKPKKPAAPKATAPKPAASTATSNPTTSRPAAPKTTAPKTTAPKTTAPKTAASKPAAPKSAAPAKPKKPKSAPANITTPKSKPKTTAAPTPSPPKPATTSPSNVLQDASASNLNKKAGVQSPLVQSPLKQRSTALSKLEALLDVDSDAIDESLLAQLIHSDEHLKMVQRLERVWTKMGFDVRVKTSGLFGESSSRANIVDVVGPTGAVEKDKV